MIFENILPFFDELGFVNGLIPLNAGLKIGTRSRTFEMNNHAFGLVINPITLPPQSETVVRVFIICRLETKVETTDLDKQRASRCHQCPGTVVHLTNEIVERIVSIFVLAKIQS